MVHDRGEAAPRAAGNGLTCPSARAEPGAALIGILGEDGLVAPLNRALPVDRDFVERAERHGPPEARFRFANACQEGRCSQWTGNSCGVIEKVLDGMAAQGVPPAETLPRCAIRASCRWYHQRGGQACRACVYVVTDQRAEAVA